tara:strand:- start:1344 stop:1574 length:231 start_codon:yes stop_codon:yes gene_type:complete
MPNVAGKKFPYTKKGMKDAAKAKKEIGMMGGGMVSDRMPKTISTETTKETIGYRDGGKIQGTPKIQVSGKMYKGIF